MENYLDQPPASGPVILPLTTLMYPLTPSSPWYLLYPQTAAPMETTKRAKTPNIAVQPVNVRVLEESLGVNVPSYKIG